MEPGESGWGKVSAVRKEGRIASVDAISLDEWHESVGFPEVRVIKIDAEGSEPFILEGMRRLIAKTRPLIVVELNDQLLREVGHSKDAVTTSIADNQYRIFGMTSEGLEQFDDSDNSVWSEILCVPFDRFEEVKAILQRLPELDSN
jgi:hypothetical protein